MTAEEVDITGMLAAASGGDAEAAERLVGLVYEELRRRAESLMKRESPGHTVQATMLVHDAYLKLIHQDRASWTIATASSSYSLGSSCGGIRTICPLR